MSSKQTKHLYEFSIFRLDPEERVLLRNGKPVPLAPKTFDILLVLVENHGQVLEKGELMRRVWPDAFVEENNLAQNISLLRKVLSESACGTKCIETIPKRGYRFAADVKERWDGRDLMIVEHIKSKIVIEEEEQTDNQHEAEHPFVEQSHAVSAQAQQAGVQNIALVEESSAGSERTFSPSALISEASRSSPIAGRIISRIEQDKKSLVITVAAVVFAAVVIGYFVTSRESARRRTTTKPRSIAILPFRNLKPDAETDFLGPSLADAIITQLGFVSSLIVRPSSYVERYRNREIDPRQGADELDVDTLLTGNYLKDGEDLRITAQLINIGTSEILWRDTIDAKYERLLTVQDRVAQQIIKGLQLNLSPAETQRLKLDAPQNPLAYESFLRGRYLISTNDHPMAIKMLEESVALDPRYALAWAYLGKAYSVSASQYFGGREFYDKARAAYDKALALNPEQPDTRILLANFLTENNRVEEAVPILRAVIEANPNHPFAHWELSYAYRYAGMLDDSIAEGERALQLYPHLTGQLFNSYFYIGQYEKFLQSLPPRDDAYTVFYRGLGYYYLKDWPRAAVSFDRAYQLDPSPVISQIGRALRLAIEAHNSEGIELLKAAEGKLEGSPVGDGEISYKLAQAYAVLGDKPSALRLLRRSIEQGFFCYPYFTSDPLLDNLRGEAEYAALIAPARQRHEEFKRKFFT